MIHDRNTITLIIALLAAIVVYPPVSLAETPPGSAELLLSEVRRDTEWFGGYPSRVVGQPGHDEALSDLYRQVRSIAGAHVWRHEIPFVVPQVQAATLAIDSGSTAGKHRLYPFWPAGPRLNTTPAEGIDGRLIYVGEAALESFPAESLKGQIAVVEMTNGENWRNALAFGARAIIFLGSESETHWDMRSHEMVIPLAVPRFYLPDGELARFLRQGEKTEGKILSRGTWTAVKGQNIYALVPSGNPETSRKAIVITVQSDSMSMVPEIGGGADAAVDTALALHLLRYFADHPPEHPLLFAFIDGFSLNMKGIRYMLGALAVSSDGRYRDTHELASLLKTYRRYADKVDELQGDAQAVYRVHQAAYRDLHPFIKDAAALEVLKIENRLSPLRLDAYALADEFPEERRTIEEEIATLNSERTAYNVARKQILQGPDRAASEKLLSFVGLPGNSAVSDEGLMRIEDHAVEKARYLWQQARERVLGQAADVENTLEEDRFRDRLQAEIRSTLNLPTEVGVPISFVFGIDLSDAGIVVGSNGAGRLLLSDFRSVQFMEWLLKVNWQDVEQSLPPGTLKGLSQEAWTTGDSQNSFVVGETVMMTSQVASYGLPHMSWATLDGYRAKIDTPQDRVDRLDWGRLDPQILLTVALLKRLANDGSFRPEGESGARWRNLEGRVVGQAPGEPMARLPQRGYLASVITGTAAGGGVQSGRYDPKWPYYGRAGMRRQEFAFTGWDGYFRLRNFPTFLAAEILQVSMQAHKVADDGSIVGTIDLNSVRRETSFNANLGSIGVVPLSGTAFPCKEMNAYHLYDPRFLMEMYGATIADARSGNVPKKLNFGLHDGIISCLMESRVRWQVIQRTGITANRLMLLNAEDEILDPAVRIREASTGYAMDSPPSRHPLHQAVLDMYLLDERRLADYRRAGIISAAIDGMRERTADLLGKVDKAIDADDGSALFYAAAGALANEVRAYRAIRDLGNDVVRAVVFLLLALIPFSFAMERLLFASPDPYRQLFHTAIVFTIMTALLWSFHPAFRITSQPLIIIMAFGIILASTMVTGVVFLKFKANLEEMKSGFAESSGAQTSRLGLASTAIKLGLANMRKRKLRTALTGLTIVLITFAMLCFTSTTTYIGEKDLTLQIEKPAAYTGVLLRQPSQRRIRRRAELYLNNIIANMNLPASNTDPAAAIGSSYPALEATYRYWWLQDPEYRTWRIHVKSPETGRQVSIAAGLGLQGNESRFTQIHEILPDWDRFAQLEAGFQDTQRGGCYLPASVAETLGAKSGDTLIVGGRSMELVGVFDPRQLEAVTDLDGRNLMVLDYSTMSDTQKEMSYNGDWDLSLLSTELQSGEGLTRTENLPYVPASRTVVLPASMLRSFGLTGNSHLRTMAIRTQDRAAARAVAVETGQRMAFPAYYGSAGEDTRILVFVPFFPKAPRSLWILMALAGLIIFNTMMSSIAERKNEIYIYTSMGLAPLHIGVLFLAEAVTYGLMGSVFGYVAGQGLATFLGHVGWLGGLSLNYSGTHAIATMTMVVCITVVSSIIPAYRAGRLAVPSNRMRWGVPPPVHGVIYDKLPFTVTDKTANGTIMYLHDYFDAHQDGAIGCFITDDLSMVTMAVGNTGNPEEGLSVMRLQATVSLAPYDLSVRQDVAITVAATDSPEILELEISLTHESGQVNNWIRLNKTFLGDLRRQLLGWRNLKARRILRYIAEAEKRLVSMEA